MFGLSQQHWNIIKQTLIEPLQAQGAKVYVFGSRATQTHHPFSDLDVAYETSTPMSESWMYKIKNDLEESSLPIKVDLVEIKDLPKSFLDRVLKTKVLIE